MTKNLSMEADGILSPQASELVLIVFHHTWLAARDLKYL